MSTRFIQAAVTDEDHDLFTRFAGSHRMTLSDLLEIGTKFYIETKRKEEQAQVKAEALEGVNTQTNN